MFCESSQITKQHGSKNRVTLLKAKTNGDTKRSQPELESSDDVAITIGH
jgi:hypothetical protein